MRHFPFALSIALGFAACAPDDELDELGEFEQEAGVCADGATVSGIDVSHYQDTINWNAVRGAGIKFAVIRSTHGTEQLDTQFRSNWQHAKEQGILRGAYQYFRPGQNPETQADLFLQRFAGDYGELPMVIDVEADDGLSAKAIKLRVQRWIARVMAATGRQPMIYTAYYFWRDSVGAASFPNAPLWVANYGVSCPRVPPPWQRWTFWQRSESGQVAGIKGPVDLDRFNGNLAALQALAAQTQMGGAQPNVRGDNDADDEGQPWLTMAK
jgi:lysozyme